ncbi:aggregation-promoting factor C-terminal-like domain-containing protein [Gulosibacter molinativorax]|uniref:aggregation-promoting factor C-terminal-like domain-containing protein n=1 Tax=Gulosibacter molinativorax TaxID=256821 RepID=UPI00041B2B70|nr:transglycosylase SLT domain-containing protein [Gulosibacter molinativorax]
MITDTMRTGSTRAPKPATLSHGRRNRAFIAIGATCALAGIAAVGLLQPTGTASVADAAEAPSLAEITNSQSQSYQANLVTAADDSKGTLERTDSVQAELEPEPTPEPEPEPTQTAEESTPTEEAAPADTSSDEYSSSSSSESSSSNYQSSVSYSPGSLQATAQQMLNERGMGDQWTCFDFIIDHESSWNPNAQNPSSGTYGLGQSMDMQNDPAYRSDPIVQINWAIDYMNGRYGSPCGAKSFWDANNWY